MRQRALAVLACALVASACTQPVLTEILVVVDTDMPVPSQLASVRYRVRSPEGEEHEAVADLASRPAVLALVHRGGPLGPFLIEVRGERAPGEVVRQRAARVSFQTGRVLELRMDLLERCGGVRCDGDSTCSERGCRPIAIDPRELSPWGGAPPGLDASIMDGGAADPCALDEDCDDAIACTVDTCVSGYCAHAEDDAACADDGVACTVERCDVALGCVSVADDARCDDGVACTVDRCDVRDGCGATPDDTRCDDGIACTVDHCDRLLGCAAMPDDAACDDGVACTVDRCDAVLGCGAAPDDALCDDGLACTADVCDATLGCVPVPNDALCDDGVACTADRCDPTMGCTAAPTHARCPEGWYCDTRAGCADGPTFTEVYALFGRECGTCHTTRADGGLDLSTQAVAWSSLVGAAATCGDGTMTRVIPRDARSSLLWRKVARVDLCGSRMPPSGMPLASDEVDLVAYWIEAGAPND